MTAHLSMHRVSMHRVSMHRAVLDDDMRAMVKEAAGRLAAAGIETAKLDAECLMAHALDLSREAIFLSPDRRLSRREKKVFETLVSRRAAREPVARILGVKEFWSLDFALNEATLVPRPDSETLVAAVLAAGVGDSAGNPRILDLGTGSGCLLLALLSALPGATGIGIDCDPAAVAAARENAQQLDLAERAVFRQGNWFSALEAGDMGADGPGAGDRAARFDIIISNPPYIRSGDIAGLAPEVARFEPLAALDGGADGLQAYAHITAQLRQYLAPGGRVFLELGAAQEGAVAKMLADQGLEVQELYNDLAGLPRVIAATEVAAPARHGG